MNANTERSLISGFSLLAALLFLIALGPVVEAQSTSTSPTLPAQLHALKVTLLSTMLVGDVTGVGEWGFSALIEGDGHRVLLDTGARPDTVLQNAKMLNIDLSTVQDVILTHNHWDHVGGLIALRKELMKQNPSAMSRVHVARGIFYSRPGPNGEQNQMIEKKTEYEATGGKFIEHDQAGEIFPGAWVTGPVPRTTQEHNWPSNAKVQTPAGVMEDNIPEDQSLVLNTPKGLVVITGCGHAGIINILTFAREKFPDEPVQAVIGGLHLYPATDQQLDWTADQMKEFKVSNLIGAHCTGIEAVYHLREKLGAPRGSVVVGGIGSTYVLGEGVHPGKLAQ